MPGVRTHIYVWPTLHAGAVILTNAEASYDGIEQAIKEVLLERHGDDARSLLSRVMIPEVVSGEEAEDCTTNHTTVSDSEKGIGRCKGSCVVL